MLGLGPVGSTSLGVGLLRGGSQFLSELVELFCVDGTDVADPLVPVLLLPGDVGTGGVAFGGEGCVACQQFAGFVAGSLELGADLLKPLAHLVGLCLGMLRAGGLGVGAQHGDACAPTSTRRAR